MRQIISPIRLGILGSGQHAQRVILPVLTELANKFAISAISASSNEKHQLLSEKLPATKIFDSYSGLLNSGLVDAIYIALPNHLHAEWTTKALSLKLDVLCEKPGVITANEAVSTAAAANLQHCYIRDAFMYKFHPQHQFIQSQIKLHQLGEIKALTASFSYYLDDPMNIRLKADCAGGALNDVGCYLIDLLHMYDLKPTSLESSLRIGSTGVDLAGQAKISCLNGATAILNFGCQTEKSNTYTITCAAGSITCHQAFHIPRNKQARISIRSNTEQLVKFCPPANHYRLMFEDFYCTITERTASFVEPRRILRAELLEQIRNSSYGA
ncbi:Gfo/Idh/MocA family oxidoreductase [bacterium]|nr:Gfo/Idh/MocA family oxidoreductase [bacterium]